MVATIPPMPKKGTRFYDAVNARYAEMLPFITKTAMLAFASNGYEARDEAVQNTKVWAFILLHQLAVDGRLAEAKAVPIARFAVGRHCEGRIAGSSTSTVDVMSSYCQNLGRSKVKHYGLAEKISDSFTSEAAATDARYPVARTVQFKMDFFEGWLQQQTPRNKEMIRLLAMGNSPSEVARKLGVSPSCICLWQKRFRASWNDYIADKKETANEAA